MSSNVIELDKNVIDNYLNSKEWKGLISYLNGKFKISVNDSTGRPNPLLVTENIIKILSLLLNEVCVDLCKHTNEDVLGITKEIFRSLRNSVVCNRAGQDLVAKESLILCNTQDTLTNVMQFGISAADECIGMVLQFLSNLVAKNAFNGNQVWKMHNNIILGLYKMPKYSYHAAAVLYNVLYLNTDLIMSCQDIYEYIVELHSSGNPNEYDVFLLELFVQCPFFFYSCQTFKPIHRMTILAFITESELHNNESFPEPVILALSKEFKVKSDCILKTVTNYVDQIEPEEVVLLLEILAKFSSNEHYCKYLQTDKGLLINCAFLLKSIHSLGKESQNNFTAIPKLSEVTSTDNAVNKDPTFGFKANLIRLVGNLCWKHRDNQDQVRELDCIPLLLDCCNIDARNPFIIQWIILAIRNLCENNSENQAVIAGMNQQGVVDSATLHKMGLTLHDDGANKIGIVPFDSLKK